MLLAMALACPPTFGQAAKSSGKAKKSSTEAIPAPPPKPQTPAEKVSSVLQEFVLQADQRTQGKTPPEKRVQLSETELNAYVQEAIKAKARYGLTSASIKLIGPNLLGATATIDFGKVKVEDESLAVRMVRSMLSGEKQIYVEGSIVSGDGKGQFKVDKAYVGSVRLPVYFIDKVINFLGRRQNPPIDTSAPVPLPYGLKGIEVTAGAILLRG
jgi:hypothetical protein